MTLPVKRAVSHLAIPGGVELSEAKIQEMIATLHEPRGEADDAFGRRSAYRVPVEGFALMATPNEFREPPHRVGVYDMSRTGVAIVDATPLPRGRQFQLLFPRGEDRRPIEVLCTARHCRPHGDGHIIGAEFGVSWLSAVAVAIAGR